MNIDCPKISCPDDAIVGLYTDIWSLCGNEYEICTKEFKQNSKSTKAKPILYYHNDKTIRQFTAIMSTFFVVFSNKKISPFAQLDYFYDKQEADGAIRSAYNAKTGAPVRQYGNPRGFGPPLFSWAEFNLYHKLDNKKRVGQVLSVLKKYWDWIDELALRQNGLYAVPVNAMGMDNSPRHRVAYPIDFNVQQAINARYMAELAAVVNDKDLRLFYKKRYFNLKNKINALMWDNQRMFYFDLDDKQKRLKVKSVAAYWALLAKVPTESKFNGLMKSLDSAKEFGLPLPLPSLSRSHSGFSNNGEGYRGSVFSPYLFIVVKGLEEYSWFTKAYTLATKHLNGILKIIAKHYQYEKDIHKKYHEAYRADGTGVARWTGKKNFPRGGYFPNHGLVAITLLIENIIGLRYSLPKKTVDLVMAKPTPFTLENIKLKNNTISISCEKTPRGWAIKLESEKLYYFTLHILNHKRKTLPIPAGCCSLIIDKL